MAYVMRDFENWLANLNHISRDKTYFEQLDMLATQLRIAFSARVRFVQILGKRLSHIAGELPSGPIDGCNRKIRLLENHCMMIQSLGELRDDQLELLLKFINIKILEARDIKTFNPMRPSSQEVD